MTVNVTVRPDRDGVWYARPYMGLAADGSPIKPYRRFPDARSREEAQAMADTWASVLTADGKVHSTVISDLLGEYIDMREKMGASPNTVKTYRLFNRRYVGSYLKGAVAGELTAVDLTRFEMRLLAPEAEGGAGLGRNTVIGVHHFLRGAFNHWVSSGVLESNPMLSVRHPSPERHEAAVVDEWDLPRLDFALAAQFTGEVETLEDYVRAVNAFAAWLSLRTGMRVGEVCGIRRRDVSRQRMHLHVGGTVIEATGRKPYRRDVPKGRRSRNVSVTHADMRAIEGFIEMQGRFVAGLTADSPIVTIDGSWMRPTTVSTRFTELRRTLGLPDGVTFHGLRHTHATMCLDAGVDIKTLSERMGHADEATTLRLYAHVLKGRDQAAAEAFERSMRGVTEK